MIQELIDQYQKVYDGKAWYGKNIVHSLSDIPTSSRCLRLKGSYNIVELVHHMLAWRNYTTHVLNHHEDYQVSDQENFPVINECNQTEWNDLLEELQRSQERLVAAMTNLEQSLDASIPQKNFNFRDLLHSIIHHDIYHLGQINFMAKFLIPASPSASG